jgi:DnaK suppressor protein
MQMPTKKTAKAKKPAKGKTPSKPKPSKKAPKKAVKTKPKKTAKTKKVKALKPKVTAKTKATAKTKTAPKTAKKRPLTYREKRIQEIKKNLLRQKETLLYEAETAMNSLPDQTVFPDLGDQASAEIDRNFMLRLRGREQRLLKKIEFSIEKIDSGSFGICEVCGEEIDIKRLEARPVTTMCISCKTEQEEEEKIAGSH